ncbi:MAG: CppA family protein [Streptococcaceae bacterium]|nr:CppA family protein [Streptococcaceae bacterium]
MNFIDYTEGFMPAYRIDNRESNLQFFRDVLGMKVLLEEGALVSLGGCDEHETRFFIEESPDARAIEGLKKHKYTHILANKDEVAQLVIRNFHRFAKIYQSSEGYAFQALSPEHDLFWISSERDLNNLSEIDKSKLDIEVQADFVGLTDFSIAEIAINYSDKNIIDSYQNLFPQWFKNDKLEFPFGTLTFSEEKGEDLSAPMDQTFDLEFFLFQVNQECQLEQLKSDYKNYSEFYLDNRNNNLSFEMPNHLQFWINKN